ncbi:hypothetical protein KAI92_04780 [Candidatus Parcubacteria bacterium]|nr:hypothetical protein [Candidatus Parcubacteria bacterium]
MAFEDMNNYFKNGNSEEKNKELTNEEKWEITPEDILNEKRQKFEYELQYLAYRKILEENKDKFDFDNQSIGTFLYKNKENIVRIICDTLKIKKDDLLEMIMGKIQKKAINLEEDRKLMMALNERTIRIIKENLEKTHNVKIENYVLPILEKNKSSLLLEDFINEKFIKPLSAKDNAGMTSFTIEGEELIFSPTNTIKGINIKQIISVLSPTSFIQ